MKLRLSIILLAAALAASPAAGQTIKSLGYNTTNGQVVYSGTNTLTFTNPLNLTNTVRVGVFGQGGASGFAGRTSGGNLALYGTNVTTAQPSFYGFDGFNNTAFSAGVARTNLGLGTTDAVTFQSLVADQLQVLIGTNLYVNLADDVSEFFVPLQLEDELAVVGAATFSTNVTVNGNLSVGSLTTTTPSTWALDATQTAAATNGILALPSNANVIRLTNNNAISGVSGGVLGAFYYLVNQTTNAVTISNVGGITVQGGTPLTLGANQAATLVATGATNASVAARGDLNDVTLGGTANTAPSQTASSGSSLMTRELSDARFPPMPLLSHWAPLRSVPTQLFTNNSGTISGTSVANSYATVTANTDSSVCAIFQGSAFSVLNDSLYPVDGAGNGIVFRGQLTPDGTNRLGRFLFSSAASRSDFNTAITNVGTNGIAANGWAVETRILSSGDKEMRLIVYNATAGVTNISESAWTTMASGSRYNQIIAVVPGTNTTKLYYTNGFAARLGTNPAITVSDTPAGSKLGTAGAFGFALVSIGAGGVSDLFVKDIYQFVGANEFGF
jgi:hypothetical protein